MEISKDEVIFTSIEKMKTLMTDTNEFKIHIINDNGGIWSESEFNNFVNSLRFSYKEDIKDEYLEVKNDDGIILTINKMKNIVLYSNTNNCKLTDHSWNRNILIETKNELLRMKLIKHSRETSISYLNLRLERCRRP